MGLCPNQYMGCAFQNYAISDIKGPENTQVNYMLMEKRLYWDGSNFGSEAYYWDSPGIQSQQMPFGQDKKALLISLTEEFTLAWTNIKPAMSS